MTCDKWLDSSGCTSWFHEIAFSVLLVECVAVSNHDATFSNLDVPVVLLFVLSPPTHLCCTSSLLHSILILHGFNVSLLLGSAHESTNLGERKFQIIDGENEKVWTLMHPVAKYES